LGSYIFSSHGPWIDTMNLIVLWGFYMMSVILLQGTTSQGKNQNPVFKTQNDNQDIILELFRGIHKLTTLYFFANLTFNLFTKPTINLSFI